MGNKLIGIYIGIVRHRSPQQISLHFVLRSDAKLGIVHDLIDAAIVMYRVHQTTSSVTATNAQQGFITYP